MKNGNYIYKLLKVALSLLSISVAFQNCGNQAFQAQEVSIDQSSLHDHAHARLVGSPETTELATNGHSLTGLNSALCQVTPVTALGIGDGCTTSYSGVDFSYIPEIGLFKGTFTQACNKHDSCFSTLGSKMEECNDAFRDDLMNSCRKYRWLLRPIERASCEHAARLYHAGVKVYSTKTQPVPAMQLKALSLSRQLQSRVENDECGSSPQRAGLYSEKLIAQVISKFMLIAGRQPTFYEFLSVVNSSNDIVHSPETWINGIDGIIRSAAHSSPPALKFVLSAGLLKVESPQTDVTYAWKVDGYGVVIGTSLFVGDGNPKYDIVRPIKGAVKAWRANGEKNILPIDSQVRIRGECASRPGQMCR